MRQVGHRESDAILGAMRQVALAGGRSLSYADTASITSAAHHLLRRPDLTDIDSLAAVEPADLMTRLKADRELAREAVKYLAIMALVDGVLDTDKLARVMATPVMKEPASGAMRANPSATCGTGSSAISRRSDATGTSRRRRRGARLEASASLFLRA